MGDGARKKSKDKDIGKKRNMTKSEEGAEEEDA